MKADPVSERVLTAVIDLLAEFGDQIRWHHCVDSRICRGHRGFPDLIIAGPLGVITREIKPTPHHRLDPGQTAWRYMLTAAASSPLGWGIWSQQDLDDGRARAEIEALLGLRPPPPARELDP